MGGKKNDARFAVRAQQHCAPVLEYFCGIFWISSSPPPTVDPVLINYLKPFLLLLPPPQIIDLFSVYFLFFFFYVVDDETVYRATNTRGERIVSCAQASKIFDQ